MKKIKFRGKVKSEGSIKEANWTYGSLVVTNDTLYIADYANEKLTLIEVHKESIGQLIVPDKNLYEGDIILVKAHYEDDAYIEDTKTIISYHEDEYETACYTLRYDYEFDMFTAMNHFGGKLGTIYD